MEFLPIYYRPMPPQQQTASPFRDLLRHMLHEELNANPNLPQAPAFQQRRRDVPEKWSKTFRLDSYQPDDVKVVVKDGYVRINAKHVGGDEDNSDIRESTRTIRIPDGVDQSKIHCFQSSENHYTVEGPMLPNEDDEMEVKLENVPAITDGSDVDMQVAEQLHIKKIWIFPFSIPITSILHERKTSSLFPPTITARRTEFEFKGHSGKNSPFPTALITGRSRPRAGQTEKWPSWLQEWKVKSKYIV